MFGDYVFKTITTSPRGQWFTTITKPHQICAYLPIMNATSAFLVFKFHVWPFKFSMVRAPKRYVIQVLAWQLPISHKDVIKWKHFPRYWPFVRGIHRWPVDSPHKGQWHGALRFSLICAWTNGWANNRDADAPSRPLSPHCNMSFFWCFARFLIDLCYEPLERHMM